MTDRYEVEVQRHPIRGALFGLLIGLSLAYFLFFQFAVFGFDTLGSVITKFVVVVLIGVAIGVAWAYLAPAKEPEGPPPAAAHDEGPPPAAAAYDEGPPPAAHDARESGGPDEMSTSDDEVSGSDDDSENGEDDEEDEAQ